MFSCTNIWKIKNKKESIKTQKVTNTKKLVSQPEPLAVTEILLESKIPTDVSPLSGTGESITTEIQIPRKKKYEITCNVAPKKVSNTKSRK